MLARGDSTRDEVVGGFDASDRLDDDLDRGVVHDVARIAREEPGRQLRLPFLARVSHRHARHLETRARPRLQLVSVLIEDAVGRRPHDAEAKEADPDRVHAPNATGWSCPHPRDSGA